MRKKCGTLLIHLPKLHCFKIFESPERAGLQLDPLPVTCALATKIIHRPQDPPFPSAPADAGALSIKKKGVASWGQDWKLGREYLSSTLCLGKLNPYISHTCFGFEQISHVRICQCSQAVRCLHCFRPSYRLRFKDILLSVWFSKAKPDSCWSAVQEHAVIELQW